jgi:hypothetical protein
VGYFFIGKQKVVLFPKYRKNGWESAVSALMPEEALVGAWTKSAHKLWVKRLRPSDAPHLWQTFCRFFFFFFSFR